MTAVSRFDEEFVAKFYRIYDERRDMYVMALRRVTDALTSIASDRTLFTVSQQRRLRVEPGRVKDAPRLLAKAQSKKYAEAIKDPEDIFTVITDIAGTRLTCNTMKDVHTIAEAIKSSATLNFPTAIPEDRAFEDYIVAPKPSGYRAVHLLVEVEVPDGSQYRHITCEIQARTLLQHAWGELTHEDTFKPEVQVPRLVETLSKRLATALAVLDEIAQDLRDELEKIETEPIAEKVDAKKPEGEGSQPVPRATLRLDVLAEAFEEVLDRPLSLPRERSDRIRKQLAGVGLDTREKLEVALEAARTASVEVFRQFPVPLSDEDILQACVDREATGDLIRDVLEKVASRKESQLELLRRFEDEYVPGSIFIGTAIRVTPRYALVQLQSGQSGILSARHLEQHIHEYVDLEDYVSPGDSIRVEVVNSHAADKRIEVRPADTLHKAREQ